VDAPALMLVGRVRNAHGIRGGLAVESLTDAPAEVFAAGRRVFLGTTTGDPDPAGRALTVTGSRPHGAGLVVHFAEIASRDDAERWRGSYLLVPADELAPPAEGEVYVHELVGMSVSLASGDPVGTVSEVYELPQGLVLEVRHDGRSSLLPFREEFVRSVDRAARRIIATPPEGLFG